MRADLVNPYWTTVQTFPNDDLRYRKNTFQPDSYPGLLEAVRGGKSYDESRSRKHLVKLYSWSIVTDDEVRWLAERVTGRRVIEVGAGTGYWAWMLYQSGVTVLAYDKAPPHEDESNPYFDNDAAQYHPVLRGDGPDVVRQFPHDVLMMVWPNYDDAFAHETLNAFRGDTFIFKGEGEGGCTGNDDFFKLLGEEWEEADCCPFSVQWSGIHDYLWIYSRKAVLIHEEP